MKKEKKDLPSKADLVGMLVGVWFVLVLFSVFVGATTPMHKGGARYYEKNRVDIRGNDAEFNSAHPVCDCEHCD